MSARIIYVAFPHKALVVFAAVAALASCFTVCIPIAAGYQTWFEIMSHSDVS
jgi:hypothetical protein